MLSSHQGKEKLQSQETSCCGQTVSAWEYRVKLEPTPKTAILQGRES